MSVHEWSFNLTILCDVYSCSLPAVPIKVMMMILLQMLRTWTTMHTEYFSWQPGFL